MTSNRRGRAAPPALAVAVSLTLTLTLTLTEATMLDPTQAPGSRWAAAGEVRYHARDALAVWRGVAEIDELTVTFDPGDLGTLRLTAVVRPAAFGSGNFLRDRQARRDVFESDTFPTATLVARAGPDAAGRSLPAEGAVHVVLEAELTLHGVRRPYAIAATLARTGPGGAGVGGVRAEAAFTVSIEAHGMRRPSLLGLLTDDAVRVTVTVTALPDPAPTPTTP